VRRTPKWFVFVLAVLAFVCVLPIIKAAITQIPAGTWASAGNGSTAMSSSRSGAATVQLLDGRLLIIGGNNGTGAVNSVDVFDAAGNFSPAAPMNLARSQHTATLLQDGTVLVAGGIGAGGVPTDSAEIFDPASGTWTVTPGPMQSALSGHTANLLSDGTVLIAGGNSGNQATNTLERYDPETGTFSMINGTLSSAREGHASALLKDGRVMLIGGWDGTTAPPQPPALTGIPNVLVTTDIYDPSTGSVSAGPALNVARMNLTATTQIDGKVFVAGGNNGTQDLASAEVFDPVGDPGATSFATASVSLGTARSNHSAFLLPHNGGTLIVGGTSGGTAIASSEIYMPVYLSQTETATLSPTPNPMSSARAFATGAALSNGSVSSINDGLLLVAGGTDASGNALSTAELYGFSWIKTDALDYSPGSPVTITGGGFQPGETVTLHFQESPYYDSHPDLTAVVQADGTFSNNQFAPDIHDLNITFYLTATGGTSAFQAQTIFTDASHFNGVTVGAQTGTLSYGTAGSATYTVTATYNGSGSNTDDPIALSFNGWTGTTPAGVTQSLSPSSVNIGSPNATLTLHTSGSTPAGTFTFSVKGTNKAGTTSFTGTGTLTIGPGPVNSGTSNVIAAPTTVVADGVSTSTITVTLEDAGGNPVSGKTVTLAQGLGHSTISAASGQSNSSGVVTFTVKDTKAEIVTYSATDATDGVAITTMASVTFIAGTPTAGNSTATASPTTVTADGSTTSTVTVTLLDAHNNPVSGKTVTLAQGGGHSTISAVSGPSDSNGVVTFTVKDTKAEIVTYTATDTTDTVTVTQKPQVTFTAGAVSATVSTVTTNPASVPADNSTTSTITVTLLDANSNPVSSKSVSISAGSGNSSISPASATTNASGVASFTVKDAVIESVTYTAKDTADSTTLSSTATVNFTVGPVSATVSTVSANPTSIVADGVTTSTITVTLLDASSRPVSGKTVTLSAGSGSSTITTVSGSTNASGQATFTVRDTKAESVTYTAHDASDSLNITQTAAVTFVAGTPTAANSTVTANPTSITADGVTTSTITVTLEDAHNNPVSGKTVTISQGSGNSTITTVNGTTNASGQATFTVKDTKAETVTYTATDPADAVTVSQTAQVTFTAGPVAKVVFSSISSPQTAGTAFNVTITAEDANGNTATSYSADGNNVTISSTGTLLGGPFTTAAFTNGVLANQPITITNTGNFTLTATGNPGHANNSVGTSNAFTVNPGPAASVTATAGTPQSATINTAFAINLGATVKDSFNNVISGATVTFIAPGAGASGSFAGGVNLATSSANGVATAAPFTANGTAGSYNVSASVAGVVTPALFSLTNNNPAPTLTSISPASGNLTNTLDVVLNGSGFVNGVSSVSFGADITMNSVTVNSAVKITANITIPLTATLGGHTVSVTNASPGGGTATLVNAFNVTGAPPQITSANSATFTAGMAGMFTVTTTGTPAAAISEVGGLPTGVSLTDSGNGTATIAGTTTTAGNFVITITAQNGIAPNATQIFTLMVNPGSINHLVLSPLSASIAAAGSQAYTAMGVDAYNNPAGDVTGSTVFSIAPDGSCTAANCTANVADINGSSHTVTGTYTATGAQGIASLTVTAGTFSQLQLLVPGETAAPGTASGKTGSPSTEYVNGQFQVSVNAVDQYWNVVSSVNDTAQITSNDASAILPPDAALTSGTGTFNVTLEKTSYDPATTTITASDVSNAGINADTSPAMPVIVVYTAGITPTSWATGQMATYTLTINNAPSPNANNLASAEITVPAADQGTIGFLNVVATNPGNVPVNWSYDSGLLPGLLRVHENSPSDAVTPGGMITITFTATSNASVMSSPVAEIWNTTAFSDATSNSPLPLASPEPTVNIGAAPTITSTNSTTAFTYGMSGTAFTVTTTGVPLPTISESGSFPAWATFTDNHDGTATISGTPNSPGSSSFTIAAHNGYGNDATQGFTLTVNRATLMPSVTANDKYFDGNNTATIASCTLAGIVGMDNVTCSASGATFASSDAGTWTVTATGITLGGPAAGNYQLSSTTATTTATIKPATPSVMVTGGTFTYTGMPQGASATATGVGGAPVFGTFAFTYTPPGDATVPVNAGTYNVSAMFTSSDPNYGNAVGSGTVVINQAKASVTAADAMRPYGQANPAFSGTLSGFVATDGITATYASTATTSTPVGVYGPASPYAIVPTLVDPNNKLANYVVTSTNGTLTITAVPLVVISPDNTRAFGAADTPLTPTLVGLVAGDTAANVGNPMCNATANATSAPGSYPIVCSGVTSNNYVVTYVNGTLTITDPLSMITVTPNPATLTYGGSGTFTAQGTFASSTSRNLANAGGATYPLHDLSMARAGAAVAEAQGHLYAIGGTVSGTPSNTVESYDLASDTWSAVANLNTARTDARAASVAGRVYVFGGCSNAACTSLVSTPEVYDPASNTWTNISSTGFTPRSAMAVGMVNDKVYVAGGNDSGGSPLSTVEVYDPGANAWSAAAPLNKALGPASGGVVNGSFYVVGIVSGKAEVEKFNAGAWSTVDTAMQSLTDAGVAVLNNVLYVIDGAQVHAYDPVANTWTDKTSLTMARMQPEPVTIANLIYVAGDTAGGAVDPNAVEAFASDEAQWASSDTTVASIDQTGKALAVKVGGTTITATSIATPTILGNAALTVNPATLTIKAAPQTKVYGQPDPTLTYSADGFQFSDTAASVLTGGLARDAGESVIAGPGYTINQGTLAANSNYTISFTSNYLTITPATLTVSANPQTKVYGQADPTLTYSAMGFQFTDSGTTVLSGSLGRMAGENVIPAPGYAINQGSLAANGNYTISFTGNYLTITPAPLTVKADWKTKVYGDPDPTLTYQVSGLQFSDSASGVLTGALTRVPGETVAGSPYAISQGTLVSNANYTISFTGNSLSITPATLTVTADSQTKVYGQADPALTYKAVGFKFTDNAASVLTGTLSRAPGETVAASPYAITQGSLAANSNYNISFTGNSLTITPAPLTITASSGSMTYGSASPFVVMPMYSAFVTGEGPNNLPTQPMCGPIFTNTTPAGAQATSCTGPAIDGNYGITYVGGNVMVNPANTSTTVTSSLSPSTFMQLVTFTAVVTNNDTPATPTGTVTFNDTYNGNTTVVCPSAALAVVNGQNQATCSTTTLGDAYPNNIVAVYVPSPANFNGSTSTTLQQTVNPAPEVTLAPLSLSFGNINVGSTSNAAPVSLGNAGDAPLLLPNGAITITGPNAGDFTFTTTCGSSVGFTAPNNSCTINVKFTPSDTGVEIATLQITDNDDDATNALQYVALTGSGLSSISGTSLYTDAVFATSNACGGITVSGGSSVDSFNSSLGYSASKQNSGGNVGTNGNVTLNGSNSVIYGSAAVDTLSTGTCSKTSVPGLTSNGGAKVTGGLVALNGPINYPAPPTPNPAPPTTNQSISGTCPAGMAGCTNTGSKAVSLAPGQYGNLTASGGTTVHVRMGTYNLNSLALSGKGVLYVDSGPVVLNIAGASLANGSPAIDLSGGSIVNPSHIPANLQLAYGGTHGANLTGGTDAYAVLYAPNALVNMSGGTDFFGSMIGSTVTSSGGTAVHYDANLPNIQIGNTIWFTAVVNNIKGLPASQQAKLYMTNASITFTANDTQYNLPVPNGVVTFNSMSQGSGAKTGFDTTNSRWSTNVAKNAATGNTFVTGIAFPVPASFPTGIQNVIFTAAFSTDTPGMTMQWQWNAGVYTQFSPTYATTGNGNILGVNAEDGTANMNGTDPAGTPETYKQYATFGATGGYFSAASGIVPTVAQVSAAPSSLDFSTQTVGQASTTQQVVLTNNYSTALTISSIVFTGGDMNDFKETDNCSRMPSGFTSGSSCTILVTFTPSYANFESAKMVVTDTANNSPQTVYLSGTGQ